MRKIAWVAVILAVLLTFISFGMADASCPKVCVAYDKDGKCIRWEEDCPDVYAPRGSIDEPIYLADNSWWLQSCLRDCKQAYEAEKTKCFAYFHNAQTERDRCENEARFSYQMCRNDCQATYNN